MPPKKTSRPSTPHSMTGFGRAEERDERGRVLCEIRSVNHRYLSLKLSVPAPLMRFESWIDRHLRKCLSRGSVNLRLHWQPPSSEQVASLDEGVADRYIDQLRRFSQSRKVPLELSADALLRLPGVLVSQDSEAAARGLEKRIQGQVKAALDDLLGLRQREGERMARAMAREGKAIATCLERIRVRAGKVPAEYQRRLRERLRVLTEGAGVSLDEQILAREVAVLADRSDITEEVDRLASHLVELERLLASEGPVGRSLEFLVQEIGREIQTIGSKAQDAPLLRQVLRAKTSLERLREQALNLE